MKHDKPHLAFLGLGWIGTRRLQALLSEDIAVVVALADSSEEALQKAGALAPSAKRYRTLQQLLAEQKDHLDALVIATPSASHASQCIPALESGLAVFCQKPLGRSQEEVASIVQAAESANVLLGVDFSYQFTDGMRKIRAEIDRGTLGRIYAANLVFHNAYGPDKPWFYEAPLSGGGCVIDLGSHLIDLAIWIMNSPVVNVTSRMFRAGKPFSYHTDSLEVEDYAVTRLDFENDSTAQIACSWNLNAGQDAIIEATFFGEKGGASLRNVNGSFVDFGAELFQGTTKKVLSQPPDAWGGRALIDWTRKLSAGLQFDPNIYNAIEVAWVIDAIYQRSITPCIA